jgi:hypothetical protein
VEIICATCVGTRCGGEIFKAVLYYTCTILGLTCRKRGSQETENPFLAENGVTVNASVYALLQGSLCTSQKPAYDHIVSGKQREYTNVEVSRLY